MPSTMKAEAVYSSESLMSTYKATRRYNFQHCKYVISHTREISTPTEQEVSQGWRKLQAKEELGTL